MYLDNIFIANLLQLINDGYVTIRQHPSENLFILNYTHRTQWERKWTKETIMCRGLVIDKQYQVVAQSFKKFFGINETDDTKIENLPNEVPLITEKMDGSLIIVFVYDGKLIVSTRGSFESEQAIWATRWLRDKSVKASDFIDGYTYVMEGIYKQNRIVVDYGDYEGLVLLTIINPDTNEEFDYNKVYQVGSYLGIDVVKQIYITDINKVVEMLPTMSDNEEGFVCKYSNGLRVKMKGESYRRLHLLITGFSSKSIWECLMNGQDIDEILNLVPAEFALWARQVRAKLLNQYIEVNNFVKGVYEMVVSLPTRKEQAMVLMKEYKKVSGLVFTLLNNKGDIKSIDKAVWKMIEPEYELPFKKEIV